MGRLELATVLVVLLAGLAQADTITVGLGLGYDFNTIQAAINDSNDGDIVIVAPGTYTGPDNRDIDFLGKAITVRSTDPNDPNIVATTIIDCNGSEDNRHRGFYFHNGEDANSVLAGLTVINGYAPKELVRNFWFSLGGAILCYDANPTITKCTISRNKANDDLFGGGGGICCLGKNRMLTITDCNINENSAEGYGYGGGILCMYSALGGYWSCTITNCTITKNSAYGGGGITCAFFGTATITNCTIQDNSAIYDDGGGILTTMTDTIVSNCTITGNKAVSDDGGGICCHGSSTITNCSISGNLAGQYGGGVFSVCPTITNCTFTGNSALNGNALAWYSVYGSSIVNRKITNCILADNGNEIWNDCGETITVTYSDVQGGYPGQGNINADPCFVEPGYWDGNDTWVDGDYHLLPTSPCIDTGDPNYIPEPNVTDIDGNPRLLDGDEDGIAVVDMGAYEFLPPIEAVIDIQPEMLNLGSKGKWITGHIWLPEDYNVTDIEPKSVFLEDIIAAERFEMNSNAGIVKFSRSEVQEILEAGEVELTVSGELIDGTRFKGTDTIRVIDKGGRK